MIYIKKVTEWSLLVMSFILLTAVGIQINVEKSKIDQTPILAFISYLLGAHLLSSKETPTRKEISVDLYFLDFDHFKFPYIGRHGSRVYVGD